MSTKYFYLHHLELDDNTVDAISKSLNGSYRIVAETYRNKDVSTLIQDSNTLFCINQDIEFHEIQMGLMILPKWIDKNWRIEHYADELFSKINPDDDVVLLLLDTLEDMSMYNSFRSRVKKYNFHLHVFLVYNLPSRDEYESSSPRLLPYFWEVDSIRVFNICGFINDTYDPFIYEKDRYGSILLRNKEIQEVIIMVAQMAWEEIHQISFTKLHSDENHIYFFMEQEKKYELLEKDETRFLDTISFERNLFEVITPAKNGKNRCQTFRRYRKKYAKKHNLEFSEYKCSNKGPCLGSCPYCEENAENMFIKAERNALSKVKNDKFTAQIAGIMRLREDVDGPGVRSLVVFDGCPLKCKYCINKETIQQFPTKMMATVETLGNILMKDAVYFEMSNGGVTFGGGEPLVNSNFIFAFHEAYPMWDLVVETSLNVPRKNVDMVASCISHWYVDIKDMNPSIYQCYAGMNNTQVISNLKHLIDLGFANRITCRIPVIPGFNSEEDVNNSLRQMKKMGINQFDCFTYKVL